jgi:hypothetical protein
MGDARGRTADHDCHMRLAALTILTALTFAAPALAEGGKTRDLGGSVSALSASSISVQDGKRTLTCRIGERSPSLAGIAVGDRAQIVCHRARSGWVLVKARELKPKPEPAKALGAITALTDSSITVGRLTCSVPDRLAEKVGKLNVGDKVGMLCLRGVLQAVERKGDDVTGDDKEPGPSIATLTGVVSAVSASSLSVHGERDLTCSVPAAAAEKMSALHVGDKVKIACANGVLTGFARPEAPKPAPSTEPGHSTSGAGVLTSIRGDGLTIHNEEHGDLSCRTTDASPRLGEFHVGDHVKIGCADGVLVAIARL